jgi:hypothetical protein
VGLGRGRAACSAACSAALGFGGPGEAGRGSLRSSSATVLQCMDGEGVAAGSRCADDVLGNGRAILGKSIYGRLYAVMACWMGPQEERSRERNRESPGRIATRPQGGGHE